jgi:hypothetical protein
MKKLVGLKNINSTFTAAINELYSNLQNNIKEIKQEYQQNITDEKIKLLIAICNGEGLNINEIKLKYLKSKELETFDPDNLEKNNIHIVDNLLDKITLNNQDYYYESSKDGPVFNINTEPVGVYTNGNFVFN